MKTQVGGRPAQSWWTIPFLGRVLSAKARRKETNGLVIFRSRFLGIIFFGFLILLVMSFAVPWGGGGEQWVPWAVAAVGVFVLAEIAWVRRRPLVTGALEALSGSYRANFLRAWVFADSAAIAGFAGAFIGDSLWIYLIGLAFALVGLWMIAPTRQDIERRQREINAAGSSLSLLEALISDPMS